MMSVLLATLGLTTGCAGSSPSNQVGAQARPTFSIPLRPLPVSARRACLRAQTKTSFPVLCPSALPGAPSGGPPLRVYADVRRGHFYSIVFSYGIPGRSALGASVPFLHFDVNRQNSIEGGGPPPRRARPAEIGGRHGLLLAADGRGGWFGNHLRFFWSDAQGHRYVITLHDVGPETQPLLAELVQGLVPARSL